MVIIETLFWISVFFVAYTYVIYPATAYLLSKNSHEWPSTSEPLPVPSVSVVISVFNEERVLHSKLENLQRIEYPLDRMTFLFGSDGSTDQTALILEGANLPGICVRSFLDRRGKASVLNDLVSQATGEIVVFSDANTMFQPNTIGKLVRHFADPGVGAVSGELRLAEHPETISSIGEASYWDYENLLKRMESDVESILGATGGVYAIRRKLYEPLPTNKAVTDDFLIPLNIVKKGYRVKYDREALAFEKGAGSVGSEFRRKVRIGAQNFNTISEIASLLHPRHGFVAFALWSHKIIRWCVPFLLIGVVASCSILAWDNSFYSKCLWGILVFVGAAILGFVCELLKIQVGALTLPYYFIAMNAALFLGFVRFLLGKERPTWDVVRNSP